MDYTLLGSMERKPRPLGKGRVPIFGLGYDGLGAFVSLHPIRYGYPPKQQKSNDEGFIVAAELTVSSEHADSTLSDLLDQIEISIRRFTADDHRSIYARVGAASTEDIVIVFPPRRFAVATGPSQPMGATRNGSSKGWREGKGFRCGFLIHVEQTACRCKPSRHLSLIEPVGPHLSDYLCQ